jgi:hypothetical protein
MWKGYKKKLGLLPPKSKQDLGPTLDKFHSATTLKDKVSLLKKLSIGFKTYLEANAANEEPKAARFLKLMIEESKKKRSELIKDGLSDEGIKKAVETAVAAVSLEMVWSDAVFKKLLGKFLESEHSGENFDFLVAVEARKGAAIYRDFIVNNYVNISSATRQDIIEQHTLDPNKVTYGKAYEEIWALVRRDSMGRFKASDMFMDAFAESKGYI